MGETKPRSPNPKSCIIKFEDTVAPLLVHECLASDSRKDLEYL